MLAGSDHHGRRFDLQEGAAGLNRNLLRAAVPLETKTADPGGLVHPQVHIYGTGNVFPERKNAGAHRAYSEQER
ncbi:hypothetical protein D3C85_1759820 [compost metagenome]